MKWDTVTRDLVILASHLRRAAHSIDSLQREVRRERENGTLAPEGADAVEEIVPNKSEVSESSAPKALWIEERYSP